MNHVSSRSLLQSRNSQLCKEQLCANVMVIMLAIKPNQSFKTLVSTTSYKVGGKLV